MENVKEILKEENTLKTTMKKSIKEMPGIANAPSQTLEIRNEVKKEPEIETSRWNNVSEMIAILTIARIILISFYQIKSLPIETKFNIKSNALLWCFFVIFFNVLTSLLFYKINKAKNLIFKSLYIAVTSLLAFYTVFYKVDGFFTRSGCNFIVLTFTFKLYSYMMKVSALTDARNVKESVLSARNALSGKESVSRNVKDKEDSGKESVSSAKKEAKSITDIGIKNPTKISFNLFYNFILSPAILFKTDYPKKESISFINIGKQSLKALFYSICLSHLFERVVLPTVNKMLIETDLFTSIDIFISLSISLMLSFNLFFKIFFKCFGSIRNEIAKLEIENTKDWWNSKDSAEFWRNWNCPMHHFLKEHIYIALLKKNYNQHLCRIACLLFSGIFHEFVLFLAFKKLFGWFFLAMIFQDPLLFITSFIRRVVPEYANFIFIVMFCVIGQTGGFVLMYKQMLY